ncbi:hypothetical protein OG320_14115 [Microbispora sp. NBC_01189]|uniref:hypothetical protein n=1 Tax=Microbispora sp. NBC_01189 TaxID=2903583 RepID=UPI002E0F0EB8|nr:hypothetical protein OG320_14115 [Microbispora sp. NBC_01189]
MKRKASADYSRDDPRGPDIRPGLSFCVVAAERHLLVTIREVHDPTGPGDPGYVDTDITLWSK